MHPLSRWIDDTLRQLVPRPSLLEIEETVGPYALVVRITPGAGNESFVLGRQGRAIAALRELAVRMADRQELTVSITVNTPLRRQHAAAGEA